MKRLLLLSLGAVVGLAAIGLPSQATHTHAASPSSGTIAATRVVAYAKRFVGYPYATVGSNPKSGFSCIGFVWYVFEETGMTMPGNLASAYAAFPHVAERNLMPGDLIFFKGTYPKLFPSHIGIFIGDGKMISAENIDVGVKISSLVHDSKEDSYWQDHYLAAERPFTGEAQSHPPRTNPGAHPSGPTAVVSVATGLNLRSHHSTTARIIRALPKGTPVTIASRWGYWLKVSVADGATGWVVKGGVKMTNGGENNATPSKPPMTTATVEINGLPVLSQPVGSGAVVASLKYGQQVGILGRRSGWYEVRVNGHLRGWSIQSYLRVDPTKTLAKKKRAPTGTLKITAHLRTGPSLNAHIIQWVPAGTKITLLGKGSLWDHVRIPSKKTGYIYAQFVNL